MKLLLIILFILAFASLSFGQTPSASPTPTQSASPEKTRAKTFGSSLRKYKPKELRDFQDRPKSNGSDEVETIGVTTDLVVNDVLVKDQNGKMVTELNKDDFVVTEDGAPQKIEVFSPGESATVPRSIVLIINSCTLNEMFEEKNRQPIIIFQGEATEVMWLKPDKDAPYPIYDSIREISEISGWSSWKKVRPVSHLGFSDVKEAIERSRATIYSVATGIQFLGFSKKERMARGGIAVERLWRAVGWKFDPRDRDAEVVKELFTEGLTAAQPGEVGNAGVLGGQLRFSA